MEEADIPWATANFLLKIPVGIADDVEGLEQGLLLHDLHARAPLSALPLEVHEMEEQGLIEIRLVVGCEVFRRVLLQDLQVVLQLGEQEVLLARARVRAPVASPVRAQHIWFLLGPQQLEKLRHLLRELQYRLSPGYNSTEQIHTRYLPVPVSNPGQRCQRLRYQHRLQTTPPHPFVAYSRRWILLVGSVVPVAIVEVTQLVKYQEIF